MKSQLGLPAMHTNDNYMKTSSITMQVGQTLIEVLVALTAAVVIIAAIVSVSLSALSNSDFTRDQNTSSQYTTSGMEIIRDMRNQSVASLSASFLPDDTYCLAKSCTALDGSQGCWIKTLNCGQNIDNKFVREVVVDHEAVDCNATPTPNGQQVGELPTNVEITVTTYWNDSKCTDASNPFCHSTTSTSCFSDFTVLPTP